MLPGATVPELFSSMQRFALHGACWHSKVVNNAPKVLLIQISPGVRWSVIVESMLPV